MRAHTAAVLVCLITGLCHHDVSAQRNGSTPEFGQSPAVAWTFSTRAPIVSSPVIDNEIVYFGGEDSVWYALNLISGKEIWKIKTRAPIRSTPAVYLDRVFLAGGNGVLACADKQTGKIIWRRSFDETAQFMGERTYDFADYYHSTPIVDHDVVYLASSNGVMNAFQATTGDVLWQFRAGDIVHSEAVIAGGKIVFGCFDGNLYALHLSNGQLAWKFKTIGHRYFPKGEVQGSVATDGTRVFFGARDYNFYALDVQSGTAAWNRSFPNGWAMSASVQDTVVYIGTSDDRILVAADTRSGRFYWSTDVHFNIFGNSAIAKRTMIVGTIWGKLFALDQQTGKILWSLETDGYRANNPKYFNSDERFRADIGSILKSPFAWIAAEHQMGGIFSTPAISNNWIVITTTEGIVYGLKGESQ